MTRDHYRSPADLTGSRSKIKTRPEDGRPDYLLDKITTVSGIRNDITDVEGFERLVLDGAGLATQTTGVSHYYANGTSGDDANDGLSEATPKKTLQAVFDLVPYLIKHNTCVHLAGTFDEWGVTVVKSSLQGDSVFLIDGGTDLTVVADNTGSPWTADIHSTTSLGLTTAGWVTDAYAGYILEVVDGVCAGQHRMIQGNTATTVTPCRNFSADPGTCSFRISRPATTLSASVTSSILNITSFADGVYVSNNQAPSIQNLYLSGSKANIYLTSCAYARMSHVVVDSTAAYPIAFYYSTSQAVLNGARTNASSFLQESTNSYSCVGCSVRSATLLFSGSPGATMQASYAKTTLLLKFSRLVMSQGSRSLALSLDGANSGFALGASGLTNTSGYASTKVGNPSGVGLTVVDGMVRVGSGVDISSCTSHGIECNHSRLHLDGAVTGTGNGGAAVYAHSGSVVHIKNGAPPTISGTLGHLSTDGTTNATWWSTLDAGTPLAVLAEMTMAKEVP